MIHPYAPVGLMLLGGIAMTALLMLLSRLLGRPRPNPEKLSPYECGVEPPAISKRHLSVKFYVVALVFIVFDVETVFLYPWAVRFKVLGWVGFIDMLVFLGVLGVGLLYIWRRGVLEWR